MPHTSPLLDRALALASELDALADELLLAEAEAEFHEPGTDPHYAVARVLIWCQGRLEATTDCMHTGLPAPIGDMVSDVKALGR